MGQECVWVLTQETLGSLRVWVAFLGMSSVTMPKQLSTWCLLAKVGAVCLSLSWLAADGSRLRHELLAGQLPMLGRLSQPDAEGWTCITYAVSLNRLSPRLCLACSDIGTHCSSCTHQGFYIAGPCQHQVVLKCVRRKASMCLFKASMPMPGNCGALPSGTCQHMGAMCFVQCLAMQCSCR